MEDKSQVADTEVAESQETATEEVEGTEKTSTQEVQEELDHEGLPTDQAARSKLGAKVAATLRKQDTIEEILAKQQQMLEQFMQMGGRKREEENFDLDEPLTPRQLEKYLEQHDYKKMQQQQAYEEGYRRTLTKLGPELDDNSWTEVYNEMMAHHNMVHTHNPEFDAQLNWERAQNSILRKKAPKREVNLKGDRAKGTAGIKEPGSGKTEIALPKLSKEAQEYVENIRRRDGDEAADNLVRSLVRE